LKCIYAKEAQKVILALQQSFKYFNSK